MQSNASTSNASTPRLLDLDEVAHRLNISIRKARGLLADGALRPVRIGRRVLFTEAEVQRFVESLSKGA